jgi:hypothetical protein
MIEKEPITVIISEKGWIRALKGHQATFAPVVQAGRQAEAVLPCGDDRQILVFPPAASSSRSARTSCRAGAATASRSA